MNIRWHSKYKQIQMFMMMGAFIIFLLGAFTQEVIQLNEGHYLRSQMKEETLLYMRADSLENSDLNRYIMDNLSMVDMSLDVLLESARIKLVSSQMDDTADDRTINGLVGYRETPNSVEVYAIKKEDLFKNIKYRYIMEEFTESEGVVHISVDTKQNDLVITKRIAYEYLKDMDVIIVAEKTMDPEFSDSESISEKLHTYSLVTNSKTMGNIVVIGKDGGIISDDQRILGGKGLDVNDALTKTPLKEMLLGKEESYMEFTLSGERQSSKMAFVVYNENMGRYYMNVVNKNMISQKTYDYHKNLMKYVAGFIVINLLLMAISAYRYTKKLLE